MTVAWSLVTLDDLYAYKERTGYSWEVVAGQLGVTHGAVYCWRVGRTTPPIEKQQRMAALFHGRRVDPPVAEEERDDPLAALTTDIALACGPSAELSPELLARFACDVWGTKASTSRSTA